MCACGIQGEPIGCANKWTRVVRSVVRVCGVRIVGLCDEGCASKDAKTRAIVRAWCASSASTSRLVVRTRVVRECGGVRQVVAGTRLPASLAVLKPNMYNIYYISLILYILFFY